MKQMKIFITRRIIDSGVALLREAGHDVDVWEANSPIGPQELLKRALDSDAMITMLSDQIDEHFLNKCAHLKIISNYAVGFNNIHIKAATENGIAVGNTPGVLTDATADLCMALLLNLSRKMNLAQQNVLSGEWSGWEPMGFLGKSLKGKTLGIYGLGRIGQALAKRCTDGFGMKLIYCSRTEKNFGPGRRVELEELLKTSDVISIHSPLTSETKNLFNFENLRKTKKDCILINSARGEIIVEDDLLKLLKMDHFFGVGLDVTAPEPMNQSNELLKFDRVLVTPHIGSADFETRSEMSLMSARNILAAFEKKHLPGFVNPEVWGN